MILVSDEPSSFKRGVIEIKGVLKLFSPDSNSFNVWRSLVGFIPAKSHKLGTAAKQRP